jgi:Xylose isomerase-like TIM barrel
VRPTGFLPQFPCPPLANKSARPRHSRYPRWRNNIACPCSPFKDAARTLKGKSGILGSHLNFGDPRWGWDFRSPGRGQVDFDAIARALNEIAYTGPMSVEREDPGMGREYGAAEAARFVKEKMGFKSAGRLFDSAFAKGQAKK